MRVWLGLGAIGLLLAGLWACGDDDDAGASAAVDAGVDAPYYPPALPPVPLACRVVGTFDPCDAGLDPHVFVATAADGGDLEDAGPPSDAGLVAAACAASGAVRIACSDDAGPARFDLAAAENGTSVAIAYSDPASRFDIGADGTIATTPTAMNAGYDDARIFWGPNGAVTIQARGGTRAVEVRRGTSESSASADIPTNLERDPTLYSAALDDKGTLYALLNGAGFWELPAGQKPYDVKLEPVRGTVLGVAPGGSFAFLEIAAGAFNVYRGRNTVSESVPAIGFPFAVGFDVGDRPLFATWAEDALFVFAATPSGGWIRTKLQRPGACGRAAGSGCGGSCNETLRVPRGPTGAFVRAAGKTYFVYPELHVTRTRSFALASNVACQLLGGCPCQDTVEVTSVDAVDVVAIEVVNDRLLERVRARVVLDDPKTALLDGHTSGVRDLIASARGAQIHVGLQGSKSELARVVLDVSK